MRLWRILVLNIVREKALSFSLLLVGFLLLIAVQFSIPTLFGADGYLHIRMAEFLRQLGPHYKFHWARYSFFYNSFADKDFLYHVALIPFTFFRDIFFGIKISAAIAACALFWSVWAMVRRYCASQTVQIIALVAFFMSAPFLRGVSEARNMVVVIALTLWFVHFLIHEKRWALLITSCAYTLTHVSGPYLIMFALLGEGTRLLHARVFSWKNLAFVCAGVVAGLLLHPNFPHNLLVFYLNGIAVPIYALKWGLELGAEFFPLDTREYVLGYPLLLVMVGASFIFGLSRGNQVKLATKIWMAITAFFFAFSFFSRRYLIYCYPLALVGVSSFASDWLVSQPRLVGARRAIILRGVAVAVALGLAVWLGMGTYKEFRTIRMSEQAFNTHYEAVGNWMAKVLPPGEIIFHANWSDSQFFIGLNPKDDYFVTLDPIFMYYWNPVKYKLYRSVAFGSEQDPYTVLKNEFKVRYGYAGKNYFGGLITQVKNDPRFQVLAENDYGVIFALK